MFEEFFREEQARVFEFLAGLAIGFREFDVGGRDGAVVAENGVVPAFDGEVGIVAGAKKGVNDFGPVGLAEAGETMLGDAGMAEAVLLH